MEGNASELRRVFEAVIDLPPATQRAQVHALTTNPVLRAEVLALLDAESRTLLGGRSGVDAALQGALQPELQAGDLLGTWRLARQIGSGGMGAVFLAERADGLYAQQVAIKLLHGVPDGRAVRRLAEERRILAGLRHPGIARLYDGGSTPAGRPYLVMEHVEGRPLDLHCREHRLGLDARLALIVAICHAVQAAHARLVVHCDLKPGNVLVREDHSPVLLDFGIAHLLGEEQGVVSGYFTPAYAAPELQAGVPATVASDVFGLGMLLVELLADRAVGGRPDGNAVPLPSALAAADCPWRGRINGDLDAIAARACALAPEDRYASAQALAEDIERHQRLLPVHARAGERAYRSRRFVRRRWRELLVGTAVLALATGFVWRLDAARARAEQEAEIARQVSGFLVSTFQAADPRERGSRAAEQVTVGEVLGRAASRIDEELQDAPVVRARLKGVIGMAYRNIGDVTRAIPLLTDAAEGLAGAGASERDQAVWFLNMLASSHAGQRDGVRGEAMARRALVLLGPDWPDSFRVAQSYNSLGLSLMAQQRYDEAQIAFGEAQQRHEEAKRDQFIAVSLDNQGMNLRRRGRLTDAAPLFVRSRPLIEREFGRESFDFWTHQSEHSLLVADLGRLAEARAAFEENLARAPRIFGTHSLYYASENARLGNVLVRLGAYRDAVPVAQRAVESAEEVMGADSFAVSLALSLRASLADARGDAVSAEADYRRALAIREALLGRQHPDSSESALELGLSLQRAGRPGGAVLVHRAIADWAPRVPGDSVNGVRVRQAEAETQLRSGALDAAATTLASVAGDAHAVGPHWALQQRVLEAQLQDRRDTPDAAPAAWRAAVEASGLLSGADSAVTARCRQALAAALERAGDIPQARAERSRAQRALEREQVLQTPSQASEGRPRPRAS